LSKEKHVLGLSGGKDSSALAIYMRDNYPNIELDYFFTDTGKILYRFMKQ
jgi:tRNA(Ile)-lysidine synthase TilS/MesJ